MWTPLRARPAILLWATCVALVAHPQWASATTPAGPHGDVTAEEWARWRAGGGGDAASAGNNIPEPLGPWNYWREFVQAAHFGAAWQVLDPASPNYGGMIEAEAGPLGGVIQTDNTLEAIWVWSRYRELTGRTDFDNNIAAAWIYCRQFPAWQEEGATDYYRAHNCAWGLTAALRYEAATGDVSAAGYADTCAQLATG